MLLVAIKWARRDDPVVLKRKKKKNAAKSIAYPGWFGKKLLQNLGGKRERGKGTKERQIKGGSYEIKGILIVPLRGSSPASCALRGQRVGAAGSTAPQDNSETQHP